MRCRPAAAYPRPSKSRHSQQPLAEIVPDTRNASEPPTVRVEEVQADGVGSDVHVVARAEPELGTGDGSYAAAIGPDVHDLRGAEELYELHPSPEQRGLRHQPHVVRSIPRTAAPAGKSTPLFAVRQSGSIRFIGGEPMNRATNVLRLAVDAERDVHLFDVLVQHGDALTERHRLLLIVRHVDHGGAEAAGAAARARRAFSRAARIEVRERLVEEECLGSRTMARPNATRCRWPPDS